MSQTFTSRLTSTDWNEEWKQLQEARSHADEAAVWDERAKTYPVKHGSQEGYAEAFLQLAGILPGETVLDMGCGTGTLATPLAQAGNHVIACDFSNGMLQKMLEDQAILGVTGVEARKMSWADDWEAFGLGANCVDVAIASRSIVTDDLQESLMKLDSVARRRACITLPCGPSPRTDERLLAVLGVNMRAGRDFMYAFNILAANGINPEVAYITSVRKETYASPEEALADYTRIAEDAVRGLMDEQERSTIPGKIKDWLASNLIQDEQGFHLAQERKITWAFIAWQPLSAQ